VKVVEKLGRSVEEAIEEAAKELGVARDELEIEVLEEGNKGIFGILGGKHARVRVSWCSPAERKGRRAKEFLEGVLQRMGLGARVREEVDEHEGGLVRLSVEGGDLGVVIGRRGQTLDALQYLALVVANREYGPWVRVMVDAEGYREKREDALARLARRVAERVRREGRKEVLEPMTPQERRIIHLALQDEEGVDTYSEGEEPHRRVVVAPRGRGNGSSARRISGAGIKFE